MELQVGVADSHCKGVVVPQFAEPLVVRPLLVPVLLAVVLSVQDGAVWHHRRLDGRPHDPLLETRAGAVVMPLGSALLHGLVLRLVVVLAAPHLLSRTVVLLLVVLPTGVSPTVVLVVQARLRVRPPLPAAWAATAPPVVVVPLRL